MLVQVCWICPIINNFEEERENSIERLRNSNAVINVMKFDLDELKQQRAKQKLIEQQVY